MLEIKVSIKVEGLDRLADALFAIAGVNPNARKEATSTTVEPAVPQPERTPVQEVQAVPQQAAVQATPAASMAQATPASTTQTATQVTPTASTAQATPASTTSVAASAIPVNTLSYSMDDLTRAAMTLMDAGKQANLQALLANFGVESLPLLSPEYYGAFATGMRGLGAQI